MSHKIHPLVQSFNVNFDIMCGLKALGEFLKFGVAYVISFTLRIT